MVVGEGRQKGGKFAKGRKFGGYASEINRLAKKMRFRLIKLAAKGKNVETLHGQLMQDATDPSNPGAVRVAAAKLLLGYFIGKPDQTLFVKEESVPKPTYSLDQLIAAVRAAGGDPDRFPMLAAHRRKLLEAR
jgi:hypothetical protein